MSVTSFKLSNNYIKYIYIYEKILHLFLRGPVSMFKQLR